MTDEVSTAAKTAADIEKPHIFLKLRKGDD